MACALQTDGQLENDPKNDLVCKPHGIKAVFACMQCKDTLCCEDCVVTTHQCHPFKKLSVLMAEKRASIENYITLLEQTKLPLLKEQMKATENQLARNEIDAKEARKAVLERSTKLKSELDKVINKSVRKCEEMAFENESKLTVYKEHMENILTEYRQKLSQVQHVIDEGTVEEIIHTTKNLPQPPVYPQYPDLHLPTFTAGDPSHLREAFGTIVISTSEETTDESNNTPTVVREIEELD
ncbi:uncharacterized protein LOC110446462 [Mizuhopecten yessoensis]|uniref:Melanoma inhibitory activity protein 3 n=1 Tax=Mizuhopecten yessoensis TaxID=6573 RepID=A0A210QXE8_MIZYE|nr:uncharacterized protein LOC110446462 [Mizuhopecten yessoensis]XP_021347301.1 uncharacterized protein LOC110446462 [Mizuhopecten yessoensis]OWF53400.1 Melanoma inhibitory activity protein 3 [Mizuhopecten yessoensis]